MLIDLTKVVKNEEEMIQLEAPYEADVFSFAMGDFPITSKTPVYLKFQNEGNQKLHMAVKMDLTVVIPCSRCLEEVAKVIPLDFEQEINLKLSASEKIKQLDEQNYIDGYNLDVDKLVYGEILVNWPMKVLCKEDCKGICSTCGTNLNLKTCDCDSTDLDPRMAKIRDIFSKFKEV